MAKNIFYENYKKVSQAHKAENTDSDRSFGEQLFPVYICLIVGTIIIHAFSFCCASIFPAHQVQVLTGSYAFGIMLGVPLIFFFIEVPKYFCTKVSFENYWKHGEKSIGLMAVSVLMFVLSVLSSTNGVPLLYDWYAPEAAIEDIEKLQQEIENKNDEQIAYWQNLVNEEKNNWAAFVDERKEFYANEGKKGVWRLPRLKKYTKAEQDHKAKLQEYQSNLNKLMLASASVGASEIDAVKKDNAVIEQDHKAKVDNAKVIAFWLMLFLELFYFFAISAIEYYKQRSKAEQKGLNKTEQNTTSYETEQKNVIPITKTTSKQNKTPETEQLETSAKQGVADTNKKTKQNGIGFNNQNTETPKTFFWNGKQQTRSAMKSMMNTAKKRAIDAKLKGKNKSYENNQNRYETIKKMINE